MRHEHVARLVGWLLLATAFVLAAAVARGQSLPPYVFSSPLVPLLLQTPENGWLQVNANRFSDVWTPLELEPLDGSAPQTPSRIVLAWSGFAWDPNRGDLILYGGGHANYPGNDVYRWRSSGLRWERASLPSEIRFDAVAGYHAIDGVDSAPSSAHTYDNNLFLPLVDRFLTWGGAAYNNGGPFLRRLESDPTRTRPVGPYLFDPSRADGGKVGGTTGSHVQRVAPHPEVIGGQMWENRDIHLHLAGSPLPVGHVSGCTGYAAEGGHDVVYVGATTGYSTNLDLYRYQITNMAVPALDQISKVGAFWVGTAGQTTCGYDPIRKLFVRTGNNSIPFLFWDLTNPGTGNLDRRVDVNASIAGLQSWLAAQSLDIQDCALEYDPVRQSFPLWCGAATVWELDPPVSGNATSGWTITQWPTPATAAPPGETTGTGVLGKWRYAPYYDVFVGLEDINDGNVWMYKPVGWVQPNPAGNALPTVAITAPISGLDVSPGTSFTLMANAADSDGTIARVEWYVDGLKVGQASAAPYAVPLKPLFVGTYAVVAVAVDNVGGMTASVPATFTVSATLSTVVLQRGLNGYSGASDTFLDNFQRSAAHGSMATMNLDLANYTPLVRFAIFQSEGGPVPDGAIIQSATLALYKQYYSDTLRLNALLEPWVESEATWTNRRAGFVWGAGGAAAAGTDYNSAADALVNSTFNPGWVTFDVTGRIQQWSSVAGSNYGWRLAQTTTGGNFKEFNASEYATDPALRPKLTVVYATGIPNVAPTVALTNPANGTSITLGNSSTLAANAADSDGIVSNVEFFANGVSLGKDSVAPYSVVWTPTAAGNYSLTAVATDDMGATTASSAISVTVNPVTGGGTLVLQRGVNSYTGASDTFLDNYLRTTARGGVATMNLDLANYTPLVRFAIFQSEGGPVPDGAIIQSATLALYKQYYSDTLRLNALLKPWVETEATWTNSRASVAWSMGGAAGAGSDYNSAADAQVSAGFSPGWVNFDVTARAQQWASVAGNNFGWRISQVTTGYNFKQFNASEYTTDPALRPKLTITYSVGIPNVAPTVALTNPVDGASILRGSNITLAANAADSDGTVAKVEFFANGLSVGQDAVAPYANSWTPAAAGSYTLVAVATDNLGTSTTSNPINVNVTTTATVILQRGLNGYSGASDTFLDNYLRTTVRGGMATMNLDLANYTPLVRFAIFQSEGGPVPDGAIIQSAALALYKQYYSDTLRLNALLKPWVESEATWINRRAGAVWGTGGAGASGTDYNSAADALVNSTFNPGWVTFDVTSRVAQWASVAANNYGWRLAQTTTGGNFKQFNASEYATDPALRPKLTITYRW